jgi:hypothetical protein
MEFTADELKMLSLLKGQHAGWKRVRIIILVCSLGLLLLGIIRALYSSPEIDLCAILLVGLSARGLSYCIGGWAGRPEISLLLKLVEEHRNESDRVLKTPN